MESTWPLAGQVDGSIDAWREQAAERLSRMLREHVVDPWFPAIVDGERGGFATDLDRRWRPTGPDHRMLEYQARQMRTAARLGRAFPNDKRWHDVARHGLDYIQGRMRDERDGGWYWLVDRDGAPLASGSKTAHSAAYVITGLVEVYQLTADDAALAAAQEAFDWLDTTLHDDEHGGYHGWARRDGRPILDLTDADDWHRSTDPLGHDVGLKDVNVHSDLLESLRLLLAVHPTDRVKDRARELYRVVAEHFIEPDGAVHYLLRPDLSPVEGEIHPGYALQCAARMPLLTRHIGEPARPALSTAQKLVDWTWRVGSAPRGGLVERVGPAVRAKRTWWVQTEALTAVTLLEVTGLTPGRDRIDQLLGLMESEYVDERHGGWFEEPRSDWTLVQRLTGRRLQKAHRWKDASHETDAALSCIRMLRGLGADEPLER